METTNTQPGLLTAAEAAAALRVCKRSFLKMVKAGKLPAVRLEQRSVRYRASDLRDFIERSAS